MTITLFDLTYRIATELGICMEGVATGGDTTYIIDTNDRLEAIHFWRGGTAWILYDVGGAGAAPQGQTQVIQDSDYATRKIIFRTPMPVAVAAGDRYAVAKRRYPQTIIIQGINRALHEILVPVTDIITVVGASNQSEYTLPVDAGLDLRQVWVQTNQDTDDNLWVELYGWYIQQAAAGTADTLVIPYEITSGYKVKLVYAAPHPALYVSADKLNEHVPAERVIWDAAAHCLNWYRRKTRSTDPSLLEDIARYETWANQARAELWAHIPTRAGKILARPGWMRGYPGDRNPR